MALNRRILAPALAVLMPALLWAQSEVNYSGDWLAKVALKKNSCGSKTRQKFKGLFSVAHTEAGLSATTIRDGKTIEMTGQVTQQGFNLTFQEHSSSAKWGACIGVYTLGIAKISGDAAKKALYTYSESCLKGDKLSWKCQARYKGKAARQ